MSNANVDNMGHLGGLITGILIGIIFAEEKDKAYRKYGYIIFMIYTSAMLTVFYTAIEV